MKLLIITQKVDKDDSVLGFFHRWIEKFAENCTKVIVICLEKGALHLPGNVKVLSLGKEKNNSRLKYLWLFYKFIWEERRNYDTVFVHMNPEYVILGGWWWKILGKKILLWFAHGGVSLKLRIAERMTDLVLSSTESGFRLNSPKKRVIGQGIDTDFFKPLPLSKSIPGTFQIVSIGRISPVKDYQTLIQSTSLLVRSGRKIQVKIYGGIGLRSQEKYLNSLKEMVHSLGLENHVIFYGNIPNHQVPQFLSSADLFVNTSYTGSLDKAILEAMAMALPVISCNEAMLEVLGDHKDFLTFKKGDSIELTKKIIQIMDLDQKNLQSLGLELRKLVVNHHNLTNLISKIISLT